MNKPALLLAALIFLLSREISWQTSEDTLTYSRNEVLIPMRDKIRLNTLIYTPVNARESLPFIIIRTPYGAGSYPFPNKFQYLADLASEGYIFVFQDIRGRYNSEGTFEMQRKMRDKKDPASIDESTDTYDTIEWLLKNITGNNGKAGILENDITVTGNLLVDIFASTTGTDADWVVKLIDVYPEVYPEKPDMGGYELMIANDVFRGRFRNSFSKPEPMKSGEIYEYKVDLHSINHVFLKGHRIMVQIQSTWFPLIDRNPQKYVPNIFEAKESDFIAAKHRIYRSASYTSYIKLPVMN
jgi:predicted acyl esterase